MQHKKRTIGRPIIAASMQQGLNNHSPSHGISEGNFPSLSLVPAGSLGILDVFQKWVPKSQPFRGQSHHKEPDSKIIIKKFFVLFIPKSTYYYFTVSLNFRPISFQVSFGYIFKMSLHHFGFCQWHIFMDWLQEW